MQHPAFPRGSYVVPAWLRCRFPAQSSQISRNHFQHNRRKFPGNFREIILVVTLTRSLHGSLGVNASLCAIEFYLGISNCHSAHVLYYHPSEHSPTIIVTIIESTDVWFRTDACVLCPRCRVGCINLLIVIRVVPWRLVCAPFLIDELAGRQAATAAWAGAVLADSRRRLSGCRHM